MDQRCLPISSLSLSLPPCQPHHHHRATSHTFHTSRNQLRSCGAQPEAERSQLGSCGAQPDISVTAEVA
jgi:hypothetical protein